jgi:hypothetical protein
MEYLEFKISCKEAFREILIAELAEVGFDSFLETDEGVDAYIGEEDFDRPTYEEVIEKYRSDAGVQVTEGKMEKVNWNEEWEKNYDPIMVEDKVYVRASFHEPKPEFSYEILINPKMSFGTGHHATTFLMLSHQLTPIIRIRGFWTLELGPEFWPLWHINLEPQKWRPLISMSGVWKTAMRILSSTACKMSKWAKEQCVKSIPKVSLTLYWPISIKMFCWMKWINMPAYYMQTVH